MAPYLSQLPDFDRTYPNLFQAFVPRADFLFKEQAGLQVGSSAGITRAWISREARAVAANPRAGRGTLQSLKLTSVPVRRPDSHGSACGPFLLLLFAHFSAFPFMPSSTAPLLAPLLPSLPPSLLPPFLPPSFFFLSFPFHSGSYPGFCKGLLTSLPDSAFACPHSPYSTLWPDRSFQDLVSLHPSSAIPFPLHAGQS